MRDQAESAQVGGVKSLKGGGPGQAARLEERSGTERTHGQNAVQVKVPLCHVFVFVIVSALPCESERVRS